jgi:hypothetical protein
VTPAGGIVLSDGRILPVAGVTGTTSYFTPGSVIVDANGNPIPHSSFGTTTFVGPNGVMTTGYIDSNGAFVSTPSNSYWEPIPERRRGLFRRR